MIDKERVKKLLGVGLGTEIVANTVGCDPSYISQLLSDNKFALEVSELRTKDLIKYRELDNKYDELEDELISKLKDLLPYFTKPRDVLAALQVVNNAKRKSQSINNPVEQGKVVKLILPNVIVNNYKVNMHGTMIEVGGRDLTPMPSSVLMKTLEERRASDETKSLPAPINGKDLPRERVVSENSV